MCRPENDIEDEDEADTVDECENPKEIVGEINRCGTDSCMCKCKARVAASCSDEVYHR